LIGDAMLQRMAATLRPMSWTAARVEQKQRQQDRDDD
jgi:hypothetical protein